jgi:septal ring factor EnvC (AmiA/AmiB activator)
MTEPAKTTAVDDARKPEEWISVPAGWPNAQADRFGQIARESNRLTAEERNRYKLWEWDDYLFLKVVQAEGKVAELEAQLRQERAISEALGVGIDASNANFAQLQDQLRQEREAHAETRRELDEAVRFRKADEKAQGSHLQTTVGQLNAALQRATRILEAWADNDVVSDDTLMEMTDEVIPLCNAALATCPAPEAE